MRAMLRPLILLLALAAAPLASAQEAEAPDVENLGTGQTLEDILARQEGQGDLDTDAETVLGRPDGPANPEAEAYRGLRYGAGEVTVTNAGPAAKVLIQEGGIAWLQFRQGPLLTYGGGLLLGVIALLTVFYLVKGRIRIQGGRSGTTVERFRGFERFSHWVLSGSFILLGLTGIFTLAGRPLLIPLIGHEAYAVLAQGAKWIHNNVSWAFMAALVVVFVLWVAQNIPRRGDLKWLLKGGGLLTGDHVPARKFNAGQKAIFWSVIILGASISASGLSLLFPFELPMFAKTFGWLNATGVPGLVGLDLPTALAPQEEMQFAQAWHSIVSFVLMAIVIAHIYIGSVGMEGAYDAMGRGRVDARWAREHHEIWYEEVRSRHPEKIGPEARHPSGAGSATPAE